MPDEPELQAEPDLARTTVADVIAAALGAAFVATGAFVTLALPNTPGWTFFANVGLSVGVALALIGVLYRLQIRIQMELARLGEAIDAQSARLTKLESDSAGGAAPASPRRASSPGAATSAREVESTRARNRSRPLERRRQSKVQLTRERVERAWEDAHGPPRPSRPPRPAPAWWRLVVRVLRPAAVVVFPLAEALAIAMVAALVVTAVFSVQVLVSACWIWALNASGVAEIAWDEDWQARPAFALGVATTAIASGVLIWRLENLRPRYAALGGALTIGVFALAAAVGIVDLRQPS